MSNIRHPLSLAITLAISSLAYGQDAAIEEVKVVGHIVAGERKAIELQRDANRILNAITADGIGKLPDRNAAEAVQRIPGISIERDQGEGRFVAIRGLPSQWSSTTLNGDRIPTAEEETTNRATAFDFFPSELIERVEVSKAITPDMESDAIGGNVNFVTATAPKDRIFNVSLAGNFNEKANDNGYSANFVYGDLTDDEKFGFLVNGTFWERNWATDNFEPRRGADGLGVRRLELRDYTGVRTTYGLNAAGEYNLSDNDKLYVRTQFGTLNDDETHYKHRYRFDKDRVEVQNIFNELITEFDTIEFGGRHTTDSSTLDWKLSTANNKFYYGCTPTCDDRSYFVVRFDQKEVGYVGLENRDQVGKNYSYNQIDGGSVSPNHPNTHLPDGFAMDPTQTALSWVELYKVDVQEKDKIVAQINYEWTHSDSLTAKVGAKYRDKERNAIFADEFYEWNEAAGPTPTLADFNLIDQPGRYDYEVGSSNNYNSNFSQVVRESDLTAWYAQNKDNLVLVETESALISNGVGLGRNFDVEEQHSAIYGMATWEGLNQWSIVGGLRLENTSTDVFGMVLEEDTGEIVSNKGSKNYLSVLPSVHATYDINNETELRLAVGRTFARPDFGDLNASGTYAEHDNEFVSGNPELDPTYSTNLDAMLSHYFGESGVISGGLFYKDITDPIFRSLSIGEYNGVAGVEIIRPENGNNSSLWGAEFSFARQFDFLPGIWSDFGINTNLTIMDSEMKIEGRSDDPSIPRQADMLYNFTTYYDNGVFATRLAINHKGEYIEEHGDDANSDSFYGAYTSVDLTSTYYINDSIMMFLELNNLTDEPLQYYYGNENRPKQIEYYGMRGQLGIKVNF